MQPLLGRGRTSALERLLGGREVGREGREGGGEREGGRKERETEASYLVLSQLYYQKPMSAAKFMGS